jgi:hypothetical protein
VTLVGIMMRMIIHIGNSSTGRYIRKIPGEINQSGQTNTSKGRVTTLINLVLSQMNTTLAK